MKGVPGPVAASGHPELTMHHKRRRGLKHLGDARILDLGNFEIDGRAGSGARGYGIEAVDERSCAIPGNVRVKAPTLA